MLAGEPEGKRPLEGPTRLGQRNIKFDLREIRRPGMN
jgi:hypothetical protein